MVEKFHDWEDIVVVRAENQEWDDATLAQLRKEYNIFYERGTYIPVMLYRFSKKSGGMIVFGFEDDGALYFKKKDAINFEHQFNSRVFNGVMKELNAVGEYMKARDIKHDCWNEKRYRLFNDVGC